MMYDLREKWPEQLLDLNMHLYDIKFSKTDENYYAFGAENNYFHVPQNRPNPSSTTSGSRTPRFLATQGIA